MNIPLKLQRALPPDGSDQPLTEAERTLRSRLRVVLVSMPFASTSRPSLQLGLLAAIARSHAFPCETIHAALDLAKATGVQAYERIATYRGRAVGDWLFSVAAFGDDAPDPEGAFLDRYAEDLERMFGAQLTPDRLLQIRNEVIPTYVDALVGDRDWGADSVVGFTSTFEQTVASIALARRLRAKHAQLKIVFGGANMEAQMGAAWAQALKGIVDIVVSGEADSTFPELLVALAHGSRVQRIPGVVCVGPDGQTSSGGQRPLFEKLDTQPVPEYGEYFERAEKLGLMEASARRNIDLPFEAARGCWWGEKRHCTFCGLNGGGMKFRSKSARRVLEELTTLSTRYHSYRFEAVDNILDPDYIDDVLAEVERQGSTFQFFWEIKANISADELRRMRAAGVNKVQPGIESLSTHVLHLMRKGTRAALNIALLRHARILKMSVAWNLIWGFPGETEEDYAEQARLIPLLIHLQPPGGWGRVWMERFSPMFEDRETFKTEHLAPEPSLTLALPDSIAREDVAYFFEHAFEGRLDDSAYADVAAACARWREAWEKGAPPSLTWWRAPGILQIDDHRGADPGTFTFEGVFADLYLACAEKPRSVDYLRHAGFDYSEPELTRVLNDFCDLGLMFRDKKLFVSLALPAHNAAGAGT